MNEAVFVRCH